MELELRHLQRLVVIADAGSILDAARTLDVTPAALAAQLTRIEARLGDAVFTRGAAAMIPTALGREVLEAARGVLAEMGELVAESRRARTPGLHLVGPDVVVGPVVARFASLCPDVPVSTRTADTHAAARMVRDGQAEAAATIRWPHASWPLSGAGQVQVHEVDRLPLSVLLPDTHRLAGVPLLDLADLAGEAWCVRNEPTHADAVVAECVRHGFGPDIRYRLDSDEAVTEMAAAARAVTLVGYWPPPRRGTVVRPYRDAARGRLLLAWRPEAVAPDVSRQLVAAIEGWYAARAWATPADSGRMALGSVARPVRIGTVDERPTIPMVPRLRTVHGLATTVEVRSQRDLLAALDRGELDLVVGQHLAVPGRLPERRPHRVVAAEEPIVVALGAGHRLRGRPVTLDALVDEAWAVRARSGDGELLRALGAAVGFEPRIVSTFTDSRQVAAAVASGRLIRPADAAEAEPGVSYEAIDHPVARRTLLLVWAPDGPAGPLADLVAEELRLARTPYTNPFPAEWP